jgi:threonine/homoserine/homoserine lactone efflux protein
MENAPVIFDRMPEFSRIGSFSFMFWAIFIGFFLSLVVNIGPAFITLVQTSIHRGFRSAAWFATGVILNDAMIISFCILTSVQVVMRSSFEAALACIGAGLILFLFGVFTYRRKVEGQEERIEQQTQEIMKKHSDKPAWFVFLGKGFVLNLLNPAIWVFWFSAVAMVAGNMGGNKVSTLVFFVIILGTTWILELLKAWGAARLKKFFNPQRTVVMNHITGIILMVFGAYFIIFKGIMNLL